MPFANSMFAGVGDQSSWPQGMAQPTREVTDLTPHVDGGPHSTRGTMASGGNNVAVLYDAAVIIGVALTLLWVLGGLSLRQHNF